MASSSNNSPDKHPKNLSDDNKFETRKIVAVDSGVDQADEEKMCIETLIQSPDKDPKNLSDDNEFEQQKFVLGSSAFARGMDRADEEKMCIDSAPLPTTLTQSSDKKDPENMSDDDNEFKKQKIVPGSPAVGCGVDRADEKKMCIGRKSELTTLIQSMASSSNSSDKDPENLSNDEFEERQIVLGSPVVEEMCIGKRNIGLSWGYITDQGGRKHMEDRIVMYPNFMSLKCDTFGGCTAPESEDASVESLVHYFGVFDGHGSDEILRICSTKLGFHINEKGKRVSDYCADSLHIAVKKAWLGSEGLINEWMERWQHSLTKGYEKVNRVCERQLKGGSTAVVVLISTCQIIAANCGDSRAILCRRSHTIPLTEDHKPDREDELERINKSGGRVVKDSWGTMRVNGNLAMSRAIGDRRLKPSVISVPEFTFVKRNKEDECIIIASDGLWDVLSTEVAGEMACKLLQHERISARPDELPTQYVAEHLLSEARSRSSTDNLSVIVIDLKPKGTS
ncbi:Protein phosphatase 2C [Artemisia annua]|uniref:protein-serine/threonine phosphatase n=1 Tax=Artemisia annua TaxID=35608 RepID=A0A2U1MRV3_ARTAN|nr:Protein phosphatase 2C [Artemisia annua]